MRTTLAITLTAAAALISLTACGSAHHAAAAHDPPAAAATHSTPPTCASKVITWRDHGGFASLKHVQRDLNSIATDAATATSATGLAADGSALAHSASVALYKPLPGCADPTGAYSQAMADYLRAGSNLSAGLVQEATAQMTQGTALISTVSKTLSAVPTQ